MENFMFKIYIVNYIINITLLYNYTRDQLIDHYDCNLEISPIMPTTSLWERCSSY